MVLLAAELSRPNSPLVQLGATSFSANYHFHCQKALQAWQWDPSQLQIALENVRQEAIKDNLARWLSLHRPFTFVINRLKELDDEGIELAVLTTKGKHFTAELLNSYGIKPNLLYGHESGSKPEVLLQLKTTRVIRGFIEDRRVTLETVLNTPGLTYVPCYLASWGYLKPADKDGLISKINLLEPKTLSTPLASWP